MTTLSLIGVNLAVSLLAFSAFRTKRNPERFLFAPARVAGGENLPGMVLSQFSHADLGHLFFNMLALYFFAPVVVHSWALLGFCDLSPSGVASTCLDLCRSQ